VAALIGARHVFFLDALTFLIAAILIFTLPGQLRVQPSLSNSATKGRTWRDIKNGTTRLFTDAPIRYALAMQLVASIAGAQILVNTVGYVQGTLKLGNVEYGWVMAAFGIGATLSAVAFGAASRRLARTTFMLLGAALVTLALLPANYVSLAPLMLLWLVAGMGQNLVNLPAQTLIADRILPDAQGRVYGAHFAWSHLWWGLSYPLAGWLGSNFAEREFLYGSLVGLALLVAVQLTLSPRQQEHEHEHESILHKHEHIHEEHHQHDHPERIPVGEPHSHTHQHLAMRHSHPYLSDLHHLNSY
jgi:NRE family putative nickel resistance protein-like MFS transporter